MGNPVSKSPTTISNELYVSICKLLDNYNIFIKMMNHSKGLIIM